MNTETMKAAMSLAAKKELPTLYFTDIPALNVVQAMLAECTGISHHKIEGRECLSEEERLILNEKMKFFSRIPLYIEEYSGLTQLKDFVSKVNDSIRVYGIKAVIVAWPEGISRQNMLANEMFVRLKDFVLEMGLQIIMG